MLLSASRTWRKLRFLMLTFLLLLVSLLSLFFSFLTRVFSLLTFFVLLGKNHNFGWFVSVFTVRLESSCFCVVVFLMQKNGDGGECVFMFFLFLVSGLGNWSEKEQFWLGLVAKLLIYLCWPVKISGGRNLLMELWIFYWLQDTLWLLI